MCQGFPRLWRCCATRVLGLWRVGGVRCFVVVLFVLLGDLEDAEASLFLAAGVAALAARPLPPPTAVTKEGVKKGNTWSKYRFAAGG